MDDTATASEHEAPRRGLLGTMRTSALWTLVALVMLLVVGNLGILSAHLLLNSARAADGPEVGVDNFRVVGPQGGYEPPLVRWRTSPPRPTNAASSRGIHHRSDWER